MGDVKSKHVVIIGGGFGGLYTAKSLAKKNCRITMIDRRNFHLFQPLLYQVATGGLSPGDIASPLRSIFKKRKEVKVLKANVIDINPHKQQIIHDRGVLSYDRLVVATGVKHHYFGNETWEAHAPGLKTVENALTMRQRILRAFEEAEITQDEEQRRMLLRFIIVGGGPTGVELAGALAELAQATMKREFRAFDAAEAEIILVEGQDQILPSYSKALAEKGALALKKLGVQLRLQTFVTQIGDHEVVLKPKDGPTQTVNAGTVLWAAGVKASKFGKILAERTGSQVDRVGRLHVGPSLTLPQFPQIYVIGDLAHCDDGKGGCLPGVAPVAMQQGRYVAKHVVKDLNGGTYKPFQYWDKGSLAVIGRNAAVAELPMSKLWGWPAWMVWAFIHIHYLIGFGNKFLVGFQWSWSYFTRKRGARLITEEKLDEL